MKISEEVKDDVVIFRLEGKVIGGPDATVFHGKLHESVSVGKKKILINMAKVAWMSSVGLGMLISALTTIKNANGVLKLSNITDTIENLLTITRLVTIFKTYDTEEEALEAFAKGE
jgi:anti-sigma B factor antagonist